MNPKRLLPCLAAILLASSLTHADTIAKWTFETSQPGVVTLPAQPGAGVPLANITAEVGIGTASGLHAGAATYSSPVGNGSSRSFSSATWAIGDYYQFTVSTIGFQNLAVSFDITRSSTGPGTFALQYSTDGSTFTQFGSTFLVLTNGTGAPTWVSSSASSAYTISFDLSSVSALNNATTVYLRLVDAVTPTGSAGSCRVDNFLVSAATLPGFPSVTAQPQNTSVYLGDLATLTVLASGTAPLSYRWYFPDLNTPLSDGSNGGTGTIAGSTTNTLNLTYALANQAGNYRVVISNSLGSVTSQVAHLTVNVRTPIVTTISHLRSLLDPVNWAPTDTTNIYTVQGTVTSTVNLTSAYNSEYYIQDNTGGIAVYVAYGNSAIPNPGDIVQVTGPLSQFNGLLEFNLNANDPAHSVTPVSSGNPLPTPIPFDFSSSGNTAYMESIEGSLVVVSNVFVGMTNSTYFVGGSSANMTNCNQLPFPLFVNANQQDVVAQPIPQFAASVTGVLGQYKSSAPYTNGYELDITAWDNLVVGTAPILPMPLKIQRVGNNVVMKWWAIAPASFTLQTAPAVNGTYVNIDGAATSPVTNSINGSAQFYRLVPTP